MSEHGKPRRSTDPSQPVHESSMSPALEDLLGSTVARRAAPASETCVMATCTDDRHPTLQGRVHVQFTGGDGREHALWVPTLHGLPVRVADRVLMMRPGNGDEWIVTGVVDGFVNRAVAEKTPAARLELRGDECLQVVSSAGRPIVEVSQGKDGPVVRLLEPDVRVEMAGKLVVRAEEIEFEATQGSVAIKASEDVVIKGELVRLN